MQSQDRVFERHGQAHPGLKPGQIVTYAEVVISASAGPLPKLRPPRQGSLFPHRRTPDRQRSLERRRRLAASGPMPPQLAARFTTGQLSVLRIVGDEVRARGRCTLFLDEVAARAGVCRRLAQGALREAERLGLVHVKERRLTGTRNDSNVVVIISGEWLAWLAMGRGLDAKNCRARPSAFKSLDSWAVESIKEKGAAPSGAAKRSFDVDSQDRGPPKRVALDPGDGATHGDQRSEKLYAFVPALRNERNCHGL